MKIRLLLATLSLLILLSVQVNAQTCTASLGDPVLNETFGAGASLYGPPLPPGITNLIYQANDCPKMGFILLEVLLQIVSIGVLRETTRAIRTVIL